VRQCFSFESFFWNRIKAIVPTKGICINPILGLATEELYGDLPKFIDLLFQSFVNLPTICVIYTKQLARTFGEDKY
jgi:hypothetical protein